MKAKQKPKIKDVPSESKSAAAIAAELEAHAKQLLAVAKDLKGSRA